MALTTRATHDATMAHTKRSDLARASEPHKVRHSPDWSPQLNSMKSESLVIVDPECHGEYVPGPCTHTPVHTWEWVAKEVGSLTFGRALTHFVIHDWGEVVTRQP